jgi:FeS assembly SUF system protein
MRSSWPWAVSGRCWVEHVGIFSFLTGKKDDEAATAAVSPDTSAAATMSDESAAAPGASPPETQPTETPFHPPEAWNTDALTAPKPPQPAEQSELGPVDPAETAALQPKIVEVLKTVYDPEIPVDIYELGLIYGIDVDAEHRVLVHMTLTSPACPSAQQIPSEVRYKIKALPEVKDAWVEIVWEPPWDKDRMSEAAKLQLGFF